ncbi:Quinate permease [Colletotrichum fructicola]|nr:Quinate permease [Colletotrichum fructicola]
MGLNSHLQRLTQVRAFLQALHSAPRAVISNRNLLFSSAVYAMSGLPPTWDQGSSSVLPSLPGFQQHFHISSGSNADEIQNFVSIVYIGYAFGAAASYFTNDRIGRLWSFRLYTSIWIIGQLVAILAPGMPALYAARIICGSGIGALSVTGPMSIVEIAPSEIRGLLTSWYAVTMGISLTVATFSVYGVYLHLPAIRLQYQVVWFAPAIFMALTIFASFFASESPRWLLVANRPEEALSTLSQVRGLPADHPRVETEFQEMRTSISSAMNRTEDGALGRRPTLKEVAKETFTVSANLRRLQQTLVSYAMAQMSGANSVTSYFIPIMKIIGVEGGVGNTLFLSGMYGFSKLMFSLISSFFFIDLLGRRKSLFIGITCQMLSHIYIGAFVKVHQEGQVSQSASEAAIAAIFVHAFGYAVGLFILPYVFGGELWPTRIRSFGGAVGQTFHWLFLYAIKFSLPSLLSSTHNWGAFIFFAGWCFIALIYVYLMIPEVSGLSVEEIDAIFRGPWFNAYKHFKTPVIVGSESPADESSREPRGNNSEFADGKK